MFRQSDPRGSLADYVRSVVAGRPATTGIGFTQRLFGAEGLQRLDPGALLTATHAHYVDI